MKKLLVVVTLTFVFAGCVGMETTFKAFDALGGGYGEEQLAQDSYIVFVNANDFTEPELTKKYFLRRSAQLTLKNDFNCFVVIEEKPTLIEDYVTNNKLAQKTKYYSSATENFNGNNTNKIHKNSLAGIIQMHKESNSQGKNCQSAATVLKVTNLE